LLSGERVIKDELLGAEHERAPSPSLRRGEALPDRIESVVVRCLESDPAERYSNARELLHALEACLALVDGSVLALRELPVALSRARELRENRRYDSDETRVEQADELERRLGRPQDDTETMVSR
jgi:serine/threonine protein kinase